MVERFCTWLDDHPEVVGQRPVPAHVETCAACRTGLDRLERTLRSALVAKEEPVPTRVRARILDAVTLRQRRRPRALGWPALVPITALAVAMIFSVSQGSHVGSADSVAAEGTPNAEVEIAQVETVEPDAAPLGVSNPTMNGAEANAATAPWDQKESLVQAEGSGRGNTIGDSFRGPMAPSDGKASLGAGEESASGNASRNMMGASLRTASLHSESDRMVASRIREGAISVSNRLPPDVIQRIVQQNFGRFRLCYENGLRNNPNLRGRVTVKFVIDRRGVVAMTADGGSDMPDSSVVQCVVRGFRNLAFPQPEGGIVTVVYPIRFDPSD